jgi:hypothetical protein
VSNEAQHFVLIFDPPIDQAALDRAALSMSAGFWRSRPRSGSVAETTQVNAALADTDFWVYVVENIAQGDPAAFRLAMIGGQRLAALLRRRRERHYFEVPWPVADYDRDPPRAMNP